MAYTIFCKPKILPDGKLKPLNAYKPTDFRRYLISRKMKSIRDYSLSTRQSISVKPRDYMQRSALSVGTQSAGSNIDALRLAVQDLGFNEITDERERDITWNGAYFYKNDRRRRGFVNKFPGIHCLLTKIGLFGCLEIQRSLNPEEYSFYPPTWFLPYQYDKWNNFACQQVPGCVTYIVKPSGGTQGKGIYLIQSPRDYCDRKVQAALEITPISRKNNPFHPINHLAACLGTDNLGFLPAKEVVQRYEENPALVGGYKADLRIYVVIESISPLRIHIYRDGLIRLASQRYEAPDQDNMHQSKMHLTNYSINKFPDSPDVDETVSPFDGDDSSENAEEVLERTPVWQCKRRLRTFLRPQRSEPTSNDSRQNNGECAQQWKLDPKLFWAKVDELVRNTIFALTPYIKVAYWAECIKALAKNEITDGKDIPNCFQILGFDLLLLEPDFRPVLLEVNSSPSLRIDCMRPLIRCDYGSKQKNGRNTCLINESRYAAFARSRVDEIVKTGLLRATLCMIGTRLLHDKIRSTSPDKASAFLESCGYITTDTKSESVEAADKKPISPPPFQKAQSLPRLLHKRYRDDVKCAHRLAIPASLGCHWMCDRISQIYDTNLNISTSKTSRSSSHAIAVDSSIDDLRHKVPLPWPSYKRRTFSRIYGQQNTNDRLTAFFLDRRRSQSCRTARSLLHCIYAEDNVYFPNAPNKGVTEVETDEESSQCAERRTNEEILSKMNFPKSFPEFKTTNSVDTLKVDETCGDKEDDVYETQQAEFNNNESDCKMNVVPEVKIQKSQYEQIRKLDKLADVFIAILSDRKLVDQKYYTQEYWHQTSPPPVACVLHTDCSWKSSMNHTPSRFDSSFGVEVSIPRMDATAFRSFVQRCQLRNFGLNTQELDLIFMKHKLFWHRVYETDMPDAESGISFAGFVNLCIELAKKNFWPSVSMASQRTQPTDKSIVVTAEMLRIAVSSFVDHCTEALRNKHSQRSSRHVTTTA